MRSTVTVRTFDGIVRGDTNGVASRKCVWGCGAFVVVDWSSRSTRAAVGVVGLASVDRPRFSIGAWRVWERTAIP